MKQIPLTQGKVASVSDHWFDILNQMKWHAQKSRNGKWYAVHTEGKAPNQKAILMHRLIANASPDVEVDHWDGDGLNNCDENLRICSTSQNASNRGLSPNNTSGFKGVRWDIRKGKWRADITQNRKSLFLGYFTVPEDAARAYDAKAVELFGDFAFTNF